MSSTVIVKFLQKGIMTKAKTVSVFLFHKHLLLTNIGISMSLSCVGDFIQQRYEMLKSANREYDIRRTQNMAITGTVFGVVGHNWYKLLDRFLPGRAWSTVGKKVVVDQLVGSPMAIGIFFMTLSILERNTVEQFVAELKEKSWRLYLADWLVWPAAQIINFSVLPTKYRVLYDNTISLGYDIYTSYVYNEISTPSRERSTLRSINNKDELNALNSELTVTPNTLPVSSNSNTEHIKKSVG